MQQLWAPWRGDFITGEKPSGCIFCLALQAEDPRQVLVPYKGDRAFIILNKFPYNSGHLMVVPNRHAAELGALSPEEGAEIFALLQRAIEALKTIMHPEAFNVGANLGRVAGAGVDQHLHFHVVPRWNGDTNFMPVLAETKVISEHLDTTYSKLAAALGPLRT